MAQSCFYDATCVDQYHRQVNRNWSVVKMEKCFKKQEQTRVDTVLRKVFSFRKTVKLEPQALEAET